MALDWLTPGTVTANASILYMGSGGATDAGDSRRRTDHSGTRTEDDIDQPLLVGSISSFDGAP